MKTNTVTKEWSMDRWLRKVTRMAARGGGYAMLVTAIMISVDIVLRKLFSVTLRGATELSGFFFAASAACAFGFALFERAHVRVDVAYRLAPVAVKAILDVLAILSLSVISALVAWHTTALLLESVELGSESALLRIPMWIPQFFCSFGLFLFMVSSIFLLLRVVKLIWLRDYDQVQKLVGTSQTEE